MKIIFFIYGIIIVVLNMELLSYLFKGFIHWLSLLLGVLDFKDLGFMWIIIIGVFIIALFNKPLRTSILDTFKSLLNTIRHFVGLSFLILFIVYYGYIAFFFENSINIGILIVSIWLLGNDYIKTTFSLTKNSKIGFVECLKEISLPVMLLYIQQVIFMFEGNNFDNIFLVNLSLLVIPIYSMLFFIFKYFVCFEDIYKKYERKLKFKGHYFMKIFNESLIESGSYEVNHKVLDEFLKNNCLLEFEEMKKKIVVELPILINNYKIRKTSKNKEKFIFSKGKKILFTIWFLNIIYTVDIVINVRFFGGSFSFLYYWILFILLIYIWFDFMKIKSIENQTDFVIYGVIYIVLIIFIVWYSFSLNGFRLSELGFIIPILIIVHLRYIKAKFPNFIMIPRFSENNFFGMTKEQYYNSINKKK